MNTAIRTDAYAGSLAPALLAAAETASSAAPTADQSWDQWAATSRPARAVRGASSALTSALQVERQQRFLAWLAGSEKDVVLRESEALLALLQSDVGDSRHGSSCATKDGGKHLLPTDGSIQQHSTHAASSSTDDHNGDDARDDEAGASLIDVEVLKQEIADLLSDAASPVGIAMCDFVHEFREAYGHVPAAAGTAAPAPEAPAASSAPSGWSLSSLSLSSLPLPSLQRLWASRAVAESHVSLPPLRQAVARVYDASSALGALLCEHLSSESQAHPQAAPEAQKQLGAQLHRMLHATLMPLYAASHASDISALACTSHAMRALLPCDMQVPQPLWQVAPDDAVVAQLRECGPSEARLPYATAVQLLRTLTFSRTPEDKAKVLLDACEEVIKCATLALRLHAAGTAKAASAAAAALGADDLLPLLVYTVTRSRVTSLPAELAFVCDFLPPGQQHGKEGYALVSLQCACRVAQDLNWASDSLLRPEAVRAGQG